MPNTTYFGIFYVTPFDPAYVDLWGDPLNDQAIEFDAIGARIQSTGELALQARDYRLVTNSRFPFTIKQMTLETNTGTADITLKINSTAVTGIDTVEADSTETDFTATAANSVAIGDNVVITVENISGAEYLYFNIWVDRTAKGTA